MALLNMTEDYSNTVTLMHPKNMYDLLFAYTLGEPLGYNTTAEITERWGLNQTQTFEFVNNYLEKMCITDGIFENYGETYLEKKSLSNSFEQIQEHLPLELATRNAAY